MTDDTDINVEGIEPQPEPQPEPPKVRSKARRKAKAATVTLVNTSNRRQRIGHVTLDPDESADLPCEVAESPRVQHAIKCGKVKVG